MTSTALVKKAETLGTLLKGMEQRMKDVLPRHITPERMMKVALVAASKNPDLYDCSATSIATAMMTASELGLEPGGARQLAALIPYNGECQFQPMYRGLIDLALRDGKVISIEAHVVHANDKFRCQYGSNPVLEHEPVWTGDPGETIAAYAVARFVGGGSQWEVMTRPELNKVEGTSKARRSDSPWKMWPDPMRCKTVVKRLCKFLTSSPELARAIEIDNVLETDYDIVGDATAKLEAGRHEMKPETAPPTEQVDMETGEVLDDTADAEAPPAGRQSAQSEELPAGADKRTEPEPDAEPEEFPETAGVTPSQVATLQKFATALKLTKDDWTKLELLKPYDVTSIRDLDEKQANHLAARLQKLYEERRDAEGMP